MTFSKNYEIQGDKIIKISGWTREESLSLSLDAFTETYITPALAAYGRACTEALDAEILRRGNHEQST